MDIIKSTPKTPSNYILLPVDKWILEQVYRHYEPGKYTHAVCEGKNMYCYMPGNKILPAKDRIPVFEDGLTRMLDTSKDFHIYQSGDLSIDLFNNLVYRKNVAVRLSPAEMTILKTLLLNHEHFVQRRTLLTTLERKLSHVMQDNTLSVHMSRLRKLLGTYKGIPYIVTEVMKGYKWNIPVDVK